MKRVLSILLVAILAFAALPLVANATGDNPTFSLTDASGKVGDEVTVNLNVANNPGVAAFQLDVKYSATDLKLKSLSNGTAFTENWTFNSNKNNLQSNPFKIYLDSDFVENSDANGLVATMTFEILEGAKTSDITIAPSTASSVFDENFDDVAFDYEGCKVTVEAADPAAAFEAAIAAPQTIADDDALAKTNGYTSFKGLEILGAQEAVKANDARFITVVSKDVLTDTSVKDYGYIFAQTTAAPANDKIANLKYETSNKKYSCMGTSNTYAGAYGDANADNDYTYVTCLVNNIKAGKFITARFYVETEYGTKYYYAKTANNADGVIYSVA